MRPVCIPEKYEILGTLGSGGMGMVWHGRDRILQREVALKVLSDKFADDPKFVQRFTTEARAAASLNHPNIVQIYEFGQTDGGHFLAMELVDGPSLKMELKRRGRFSESETITLARQACAALKVAHAAGIVHRDIKPDNMMFTSDRQFKLVDLGLAKKLDDEISQTMTGQSLGTPHFISPEQILCCGEIDARADIYSLGATLYYLATGSVPFEGSSGAHIMSRHLNDPLPDPRRVAPDLSPDFCRVLGRMMAKEPKDRYFDMATLDVDLLMLTKGGKIDHVAPMATTVQETIFMSSPDLGHETVAVSWDEENLKSLAAALAQYVGPMAKLLVEKASQKAGSCGQLVAELSEHIPAGDERDAFRARCDRLASGGQISHLTLPDVHDPGATMAMAPTAGQHAQLDSAATGQSHGVVFQLNDKTLAVISHALAEQIGPVARILVKREMKVARDLTDLTSRLLTNVSGVKPRREFEMAMKRLD